MTGDKWINASELIRSLSVDPYECPGCPEPDFLPELIAMVDEIDEFYVEDCSQRLVKAFSC